MADLIYKPYNIEKIYGRCVQKFSMESLSASSNMVAISTLAYAESWSCFVKWCKTQLDLDRTVILPNFGILFLLFI